MEELYNALGRKQLAFDSLKTAFDAVILELARLVAGETDPSRYMVNLTEGSFIRVPQGERPTLPATVNGVPNCVVCPDSDSRTRVELLATILNLTAVKEADAEGRT